MNPLHFCIAISPLAVYWLLLGVLCLRRRPFVTTNARDVAIIGMAVSGLVVIGPMELFFPEAAVARFGPFVWVMLLFFYALCLSMVSLMVKPGLIIYNVHPDQLRPVLAEVLQKLDRPQWMGDNVRLPNGKIQFHLDWHPLLRNVTLSSCGREQNLDTWRRLESALTQALKKEKVSTHLLGPVFVSLSLAATVFCVSWMYLDPEGVVLAFKDMMRQ